MNGTGNVEDNSAETVPPKRFADHSINGVWGYTYFVEIDGLIKIGHSGAPKQRLSSFGPTKKVLAIVPNTIISEGDAHRKFAHLRERGELFRIAPDLLAFIDHVKAEADAMPKKEFPTRNTEYDETRSMLKILAMSHGAGTAIGRACHNLLEMTENFAKSQDADQQINLRASINRELARLETLRRQVAQ